MAGEINGTNVVIENGTGEIVGQMEMTLTPAGTPIVTSNKSNGDFVTYLDGELAGKQINFSGTIVYNNDAQYQNVLNDEATGTADTYTITFPGGGTTDLSYTGSFVPTGMSAAIPHGASVSTSITFASTGAYTRTPYAA